MFSHTFILGLGFLYLSVLMDALEMAIEQHRPIGETHHSDQGSQHTALTFGKRYREENSRLSMGSVRDYYDNALCGIFFASLECILLKRDSIRSRGEAGRTVLEFIEDWYNPHRCHSSSDQVSPVRHEKKYDFAT
jgi:putative transposase